MNETTEAGKIITIERVEPENIKAGIESTENIFLLLSGYYFLHNSLGSANTIVKEIDFSSSTYWVWEGTEFDDPDDIAGQEHYRQGPLLVQLPQIGNTTSPLLDVLFKEWSEKEIGIVLQSSSSIEVVNRHLQSIIWLQGENQAEERYGVYLQTPKYLRPWFQSFTANNLAAFMGPIRAISWLEKRRENQQWLTQLNPEPAFREQTVGWFTFDNAQQQRYETLETNFVLRELISLVMKEQKGCDEETALQQANNSMQQAKELDISDSESMYLVMKINLSVKDTSESEGLLRLLANSDLPVDVRNRKVAKYITKIEKQAASRGAA